MWLSIFSILGQLIPAILANRGVIGSTTQNLITGLLTPAEELMATVRAGNTKTQDGLAALAAIQGVVNVLKATTGLPADVLTQVMGIDADVQAALTAYAKAGLGFDPSVYAPIAGV